MLKNCITLILLSSALYAKPPTYFMGEKGQPQLTINNRILSSINGKPITVIDLQKQMDMIFYHQFPEYASSSEAKFQFYSTNWKHFLNELMDKELVINDARQNKMEVKSGEIREELERNFGPDVMGNLDKIGISFDEAWTMTEEDLLLRRMMYMRVNMKAMRKITPKVIQDAYNEYCQKNCKPDTLSYSMITVRGGTKEENQLFAKELHHKLTHENVAMDELESSITEKPNNISYKVSQTFESQDKDIQEDIRQQLQKLESGHFSEPIAQQSRDNSIVHRIFCLKEKNSGAAPSFAEAEKMVKERLLQKEMMKEKDNYMSKLRHQYNVSDSNLFPPDYQPFTLQ